MYGRVTIGTIHVESPSREHQRIKRAGVGVAKRAAMEDHVVPIGGIGITRERADRGRLLLKHIDKNVPKIGREERDLIAGSARSGHAKPVAAGHAIAALAGGLELAVELHTR